MELPRDNLQPEVMLQKSQRYSIEKFQDLLYGGVNMSLPDFGGPECSNYRSSDVIVTDTFFMLLGSVTVGWWAYRKLRSYSGEHSNHGLKAGRQLLLVAFCIIMGLILGFKLVNRHVIYLLQPCHVTSIFQIYLLAAPANKFTTTMFRVHVGFLNGAVVALLFPPDAYDLPGELEMFWIQHIVMILVPLYLVTLGEPYTCESLSDMSYCGMSSSLSILYHVLLLQPVSIFTGINVDYTLCPPPSLPSFVSGRHYLLSAGWHVPFVMVVCTKIVGVLSAYLRPANPQKMDSKLS